MKFSEFFFICKFESESCVFGHVILEVLNEKDLCLAWKLSSLESMPFETLFDLFVLLKLKTFV